ncbi:MAG: ABC transporter substrate-binding protein [Rhodobacteraceae bacterium]|nr:ABC transporter substrate-binding protein [Paracoccaceae bacterium]
MSGRGLKGLVASVLLALVATPPASAETPTLKIAVLEFGTVNWELDTIDHYGLDNANGFEMDIRGVAGGSAAQVAFQGGTVDVIVSDWIWVARQRAAGKDFVVLPYSRAVGGVMVPADSSAQTLADLKGGDIGIAGGPLDKSWLVLRAYAQQAHQMDLAAETEQVFGAPPLIFKQAVDGKMAGAINYWHFMAKMKAAGMRELISVSDAAEALGLDPETPLLGYVFKGEMLAEQPELVRAFAAASRQAKELLATDDEAWERLRPMMRAGSDAEFEELKAGYRAGIPAPGGVAAEDAAAFFALMAELGGRDLVGEATELPEGVFVAHED